MRKNHDFYIYPLIFEKFIDFQVNIVDKRVQVTPFFLQYLDADDYGVILIFFSISCKTTRKFL